MNPSIVSYKNHRFPPPIIAHAVWLYFRCPLSLRLVEEMLLERGIIVSYETIKRWSRKFGAAYAKQLRRGRGRSSILSRSNCLTCPLDLSGLANRDTDFKLPTGRGDEFAHGGGPDSRDRPKVVRPRDMFVPDLHIDTLKVKSRNFQ